MARSVIARRVMSVDCIHSNGVDHGDLHLCSVVLRLPAHFNKLPIPQIYGKYSTPIPEPIIRHDG
ncbi:uncharacterized protein BDW43DRAFT_316311 [Aspergillus alliaceus]|uniref:uncharacterized protein n=1 Tax=Petromyces alliaceus TaxID=209559 RepID=UPI0012A64E9B|nr:uncharacterized protein BDW43DRAFT_316311 [Aspergillus alliaceus]KAB8228005.1 hypothetical protein BDW43DRAFT_316311 [Aspergillus alliaceus]